MLDRKRGKNISQDGRNSVSVRFYLDLRALCLQSNRMSLAKAPTPPYTDSLSLQLLTTLQVPTDLH